MNGRFKKGAASFYVVAFSTLILLIIVASFTALVIAQIARTSNADLSQSAYDSAMSGVEDAKLAFYSYQNCLMQGVTDGREPVEGEEIGCPQIVWMMEHPEEEDCDMVANILGRTVTEGVGVSIDETTISATGIANSNNMSQWYTCVRVKKDLNDYRTTLSDDNQISVIKPTFEKGVAASSIRKIQISWGSSKTNVRQLGFSSFDPTFPSASNFSKILDPPVISVALLQAEDGFSLDDFDRVSGNNTNRGTVYLVPYEKNQVFRPSDNQRFVVANNNTILAADIAKSNNRTFENKPFAVKCDPDSEMFLCTAVIELPQPIDSSNSSVGRSDDNFLIAVSLPYGKPETNVSLRFFKDDIAVDELGKIVSNDVKSVTLEGMQIGVDSTGKANDLFRRVEVRLEEKDDSALSIMGPLELLDGGNGGNGGNGGGSSSALQKDLTVTCEWNFAKTCE